MDPAASPKSALLQKSAAWSLPIKSLAYARRMDQEDELRHFRSKFCIPRKAALPHAEGRAPEGDPEELALYFSGHSLGLKPKLADEVVGRILADWGALGFDANFHGYCPMAQSDQKPKKVLTDLVGASQTEVAVMNSLSVNLHLLLATFYKPTAERYKILIEEHAFPTDLLAVESHLRLHGRDPKSDLILVRPREGEHLIREADVVKLLEEQGPSIALMLFPGVQYYTGQFFDLQLLVESAHKQGIVFGADLAHCVGNVKLQVHSWGVDFAVWCTYKYLNSGPGGVGAIFVHEKHLLAARNGGSDAGPMLKGWWGSQETSRFLKQGQALEEAMGADMFRVSTPHALLNGALWASLQVIGEAGLEPMVRKQFLLTGYLEYLLLDAFGNKDEGTEAPILQIITPADPGRRGCQISLMFTRNLELVQAGLLSRGIVCDVRMPNVIRIAPIPLYNTFEDVHKFVINLQEICSQPLGN